MGCLNSKDAKFDVSAQAVDLKEVNPKEEKAVTMSEKSGSPAKSPTAGPSPSTRQSRKSQTEEGRFEAWNTMEEAEESSYLSETEDTQGLEEQLKKAFPKQGQKRSEMSDMSFWRGLLEAMPDEESDFELTAPWTMEQASRFYKHLLLTDERRRNPKRAEGTPAISRKSVYNLMIGAYELYDQKHADMGALQDVKAPTSSTERLLVCGDTHGQLQDVLWIFDEHGEPSASNAYLFNGDIADRGRDALEILLLLLTYQLADPGCVYINRGNHEQRDLNERPFAQGGGFAWEVRAKYPHDEHLVELFQRFFNSMPIAALVGEWAFVIHGGLFREPNITIEDVRKINNRRAPPQALKTYDDNLLFDALWADPHGGLGVKVGSSRGAFSATFGSDVTKDFCARNGVKSIVRSHQLPKQRRGFEIQHDSMLLTIFSASNYGGACRNKGGVLIFDEHGPAEVKEFYAPQLEQFRAMVEFRAAEKIKGQLDVWKKIALSGGAERDKRQLDREKQNLMQMGWKHLLVTVNEAGEVSQEDQELVDVIEGNWKKEVDEEASELPAQPPGIAKSRSVIMGHGSSASDVGSPAGRNSGSGGMPVSPGSHKSKAMRRRTLMTHLMREGERSERSKRSDDAAPATGGAPGTDEFTHGVVFVEEEDQGHRTDGDIMHQLLAELCKCKGGLLQAFITAEKAEAEKVKTPAVPITKSVSQLRRAKSVSVSQGAMAADAASGSERSLKGEDVTHKVAYETWVGVLAKHFPQYAALWRQYGPKIVGSAAYPPMHATGGRPVAGCKVGYLQFLDRFQVQIAYDTFDSFHQALLGRLYERLLERTKQMPMGELFAYFDPDHSGGVEHTELEQALTNLDLGLTTPQLQQLILTLGFQDGKADVEPFEAITLLLEHIGPYIRKSAHTTKGLGKRTGSGLKSVKSGGVPADAFVPDEAKRAVLDTRLRTLAVLIHSKLPAVMATLGGQTVQSIFAEADADKSGVLSMAEAINLLKEIQATVGGEPVVSSEEELEELVRYIDLDGNGQVSFVEFVVAFGTSASAREAPTAAASLAALGAEEARDEIVEGLIRQVCSALYERMHLLQRAFGYLDVHGDGWVPVTDFEQALTLVMSLPPSNRKDEGAAAEAVTVDASQIHALVASLRGSALLDDQREPPQIDWTGFIQAFEVVDTEPDP